MTKYGVYENNKPCSRQGYPNLKFECWSNHVFPTFEEAVQYARDWLGAYGDYAKLELDIPFNYNGYGDMIEIKEIEE